MVGLANRLIGMHGSLTLWRIIMVKKFRCARCKRNFSMAAHLARHNSTIHARGRKKTVAARSASGKRGPGRPRGSGRPIVRTAAAFSDGAARVISEMQSYHDTLLAQRAGIEGEIGVIADAMRSLGSRAAGKSTARTPGKRGPGRPPGKSKATSSKGGSFRTGTLKDYIVRVLKQNTKPLSPNDIGTRILKTGFKTKAKDLTKAISNTLPQLKEVERLGFGKYTLGGK